MPIPIRCDCGHSFQVATRLAGKETACPDCGSVIAVPAAGATTSAVNATRAVSAATVATVTGAVGAATAVPRAVPQSVAPSVPVGPKPLPLDPPLGTPVGWKIAAGLLLLGLVERFAAQYLAAQNAAIQMQRGAQVQFGAIDLVVIVIAVGLACGLFAGLSAARWATLVVACLAGFVQLYEIVTARPSELRASATLLVLIILGSLTGFLILLLNDRSKPQLIAAGTGIYLASHVLGGILVFG